MNQTPTLAAAPALDESREITVTVLYFARLREALGRGTEQVTLPAGPQTVAVLHAHLCSRGGVWSAELGSSRPVRVAVNQDMARGDTPLAEGDEVAFFPPVTGG
jgi:molybdopterin synthase sulfur carrier subunit